MKQKTISQLKKDCWKLLSTYIRRKHKLCQVCKKAFSQHAHHIIKRSISNALYLDERNIIALCSRCHNKFHPTNRKRIVYDDVERAEVLMFLLGREGLEYLANKRHDIKKWTHTELEEMIQDYKQRIKEAEEL